MHLLTPKGMNEKLSLTFHFLKRKEEEYRLLKDEITRMRHELNCLAKSGDQVQGFDGVDLACGSHAKVREPKPNNE